MTKQELIVRVYEAELARRERTRRRGRVGQEELTKKNVAAIVDEVFAQLGDYFLKEKLPSRGTRAGVKFTYPGFGTFTKRLRRGRPGRNPKTGEEIPIPPSVTVAFAPGSDLKGALNREPPKVVRAPKAPPK